MLPRAPSLWEWHYKTKNHSNQTLCGYNDNDAVHSDLTFRPPGSADDVISHSDLEIYCLFTALTMINVMRKGIHM